MFYLACKQCTCMPDESGCGSPLYTPARVRKKKRTLRCALSIRIGLCPALCSTCSSCFKARSTCESRAPGSVRRRPLHFACLHRALQIDRLILASVMSLRLCRNTPNWNTRCDDQARGRYGFNIADLAIWPIARLENFPARKMGYPFLEGPRNICRAPVKALLTWPAPSPMSICIIIRQWAPCFMHEGKNAWTICPRPAWPRVNLCAMLPRPPRSSHSVSKLHTDAQRGREGEREREREEERERERRYQSRRVEIIREIGRGLEKGKRARGWRKKITPGSRFYLSRDPICMQICPETGFVGRLARLYRRAYALSHRSRSRTAKSCRFGEGWGERKDWIISPEETSIHFDSGAERDNIRKRDHCFKFVLDSARRAARAASACTRASNVRKYFNFSPIESGIFRLPFRGFRSGGLAAARNKNSISREMLSAKLL